MRPVQPSRRSRALSTLNDGRHSPIPTTSTHTPQSDEVSMRHEQNVLDIDDDRTSPIRSTSTHAPRTEEDSVQHEQTQTHDSANDASVADQMINAQVDSTQIMPVQSIHVESVALNPNETSVVEPNDINSTDSPSNVKTDPDVMSTQKIVDTSNILSILVQPIAHAQPQMQPSQPHVQLPPQLHTYKDEDVEMSWTKLPKPMEQTNDKLLKRDDDPFSGNIQIRFREIYHGKFIVIALLLFHIQLVFSNKLSLKIVSCPFHRAFDSQNKFSIE